MDPVVSAALTKVKGVVYTNTSQLKRIFDVADYVIPPEVSSIMEHHIVLPFGWDLLGLLDHPIICCRYIFVKMLRLLKRYFMRITQYCRFQNNIRVFL